MHLEAIITKTILGGTEISDAKLYKCSLWDRKQCQRLRIEKFTKRTGPFLTLPHVFVVIAYLYDFICIIHSLLLSICLKLFDFLRRAMADKALHVFKNNFP